MNKIKNIRQFVITLLCCCSIMVAPAYAKDLDDKVVEAARLDVQKNEASIEKENSKEERYRLNIEPLLRVTVAVDEEDRLLTINWKDCVPAEATKLYVVVKGNRYDIYNADFNPAKVDSCQVSYEDDINTLETRIYLRHGRDVYTEPIYKTVYVEPVGDVEKDTASSKDLSEEETAMEEDSETVEVDAKENDVDEVEDTEDAKQGSSLVIAVISIVIILLVLILISILLRKK